MKCNTHIYEIMFLQVGQHKRFSNDGSLIRGNGLNHSLIYDLNT